MFLLKEFSDDSASLQLAYDVFHFWEESPNPVNIIELGQSHGALYSLTSDESEQEESRTLPLIDNDY